MKLKKYLAWFLLFSFACGPSTDWSEYFTVFYPEAANNPAATEAYFYTSDFLNQQYFMGGSTSLADSINLESWVNYTDEKISKEEFKTGLYDKISGLPLANKLRGIGKNAAADYVTLVQEIDKETEKYPQSWEPVGLVNEQLLSDLRDIVLINGAKVNDDFLKERYAFQALKIDGKLNDTEAAIADYHNLKDTYETKTFISEWIQSRYAGALLRSGETAKSLLEFAKVFEKSPTRRYQADLSIRGLKSVDFEKAIAICENDAEKLAVYSLAAIQPGKDGLIILEKMVAMDPNYPMLELVMAREINKNELNFYVKKNGGRNSFEIDPFDENYELDSSRAALIKSKGSSYFEKILRFNEKLLEAENLENKAYWYTSAAYLNYVGGSSASVEHLLAKAKDEGTENAYLQKQIALLQAMTYLDESSIAENENEILDRITDFKEVSDFRDNNVLVSLTEKLSKKYTEAIQKPKAIKTGWLSSCTSSQETVPVLSPNRIKAFLTKHIVVSKGLWLTYSYSGTEADLLKGADIELLKNTLDFLASELTAEERKLVSLASLNEEELLMAYGRKLIRTQHYAEALETFKKLPESKFYDEPFSYHFSPLPDQYIMGETLDEDLLSPLVYLEKVSAFQQATLDKPDDAKAWYDLGLAAYNMSYWGNGWLFSDREWSQLEIEYGEPTGEDYFTNYYAKDCFEKALAANPDLELGAMICYMGALCERNQYNIAYSNGKPNTYEQKELDYYRIKMETSVKPTFQSFFKRLKNQYDEAAYESQVIKECMLYVNFKLR